MIIYSNTHYISQSLTKSNHINQDCFVSLLPRPSSEWFDPGALQQVRGVAHSVCSAPCWRDRKWWVWMFYQLAVKLAGTWNSSPLPSGPHSNEGVCVCVCYTQSKCLNIIFHPSKSEKAGSATFKIKIAANISILLVLANISTLKSVARCDERCESLLNCQQSSLINVFKPGGDRQSNSSVSQEVAAC